MDFIKTCDHYKHCIRTTLKNNCVLTCLLLVLSVSCHCQNETLTKREVYNFNRGDIFQYVNFRDANALKPKIVNPSSGKQLKVLRKVYKGSAKDTVVYKFQKQSFIKSNEPTLQYQISVDTVTKTFGHLDSPILNLVPVYYPSYPRFTDTLFKSNKCGRPIVGYRLTGYRLEREGKLWGKGIGKTYQWENTGDNSKNLYSGFQLVYYQKAKSGKSCGKKLNIFCEKVKAYRSDQIKLFPNPAETRFNLLFPGQKGQPKTIDLYDQKGRKILSKQTLKCLVTLKLPSLAAGIYTIRIGVGHNEITKKLVVTNH